MYSVQLDTRIKIELFSAEKYECVILATGALRCMVFAVRILWLQQKLQIIEIELLNSSDISNIDEFINCLLHQSLLYQIIFWNKLHINST